MDKKPSRFDRMRAENESLKPLLKKAGLPAAGKERPADPPKGLSDKAAEAVARTLRFYMDDKKGPSKGDG